MNATVWYPAETGSESGKVKDTFSTLDYLPEMTGTREDYSVQMDCYANLPIDSAHGPYPIIIFVHGTASYRYASYVQMTHWASRGFVVICADNPGIYLGDFYSSGGLSLLSYTPIVDTKTILSAARSASGELSFLDGHIDADRIGLAGHSIGGVTVGGLSSEEGVQVIVTMAGGGGLWIKCKICIGDGRFKRS